MKIFAQLSKFISKPSKFVHLKNEINLKIVLREIVSFIFFDSLSVLIWGILLVLSISFFESFKTLFNTREFIANSPPLKLFYIILLGPIIEEIAFRLPLKPTRLNLAIGISFQIVIFLNIFEIISFSLLTKIVLMLGLSILPYIFLNNRIEKEIGKKVDILIYYNILAFGLIHITNYEFTSLFQMLFIPNLILIQLILGIYLSYIRLKYNFYFGLMFHILHNFIFLSLGYLSLR